MGLAFYMLGVEDNGDHSLSSISDLKKSVSSLARIAKSFVRPIAISRCYISRITCCSMYSINSHHLLVFGF